MKTTLLLALCLLPTLPTFAQPRPGRGAPKADDSSPWSGAEYVFVAKLTDVIQGPVAQSFPPIYDHTLKLTIEKSLRGGLAVGTPTTAHNSAHQQAEPTFPMGKSCLVAARNDRGTMVVTKILESSPALVDEATAACSMPLGWKLDNGKPISPWAVLGEKAWPKDFKDPAVTLVCSKTGRPAYLAGNVSFEVEKVPPTKEIQWTNPDGDGEYKITVRNETATPISIPALLSVDGKVLWEESLLITCQKKTYLCPGSKGVTGNPTPTTLEPKQSLSTTVNILRLTGPEWPQGGYRIEFQFSLGEKSQTQSLYYMSRHHDALRAAAQKIK